MTPPPKPPSLLTVALSVAVFFALLFGVPIILQGWQDLNGTVKAAQEFKP